MILNSISVYERLRKYFPEIEAFRVSLEEAYNGTESTGIQVDIANSIFECVGKNAWACLDTAPSHSVIEKAKLSMILREAKVFFKENDPDFYEDIYTAIASSGVRILGNRSTSGDISHGHLHTKKELSPCHAVMSLNLALTFASYYFYALESSTGLVNYDDHSGVDGFNEWLNSKGERIGGSSYSWLLYQHDYDAFESYLDEYNSLKK